MTIVKVQAVTTPTRQQTYGPCFTNIATRLSKY